MIFKHKIDFENKDFIKLKYLALCQFTKQSNFLEAHSINSYLFWYPEYETPQPTWHILMSNSSWMSIKHLPFRFPPQVRGLWILKDRLGPEHPVIEPEIWWALLVVFEFSQPERNSILAILLCPRSTELLKSGLQGPFRKKRKIGKCKYCFDFFLKLMYFLWNLRPFVKGSANTYQN